MFLTEKGIPTNQAMTKAIQNKFCFVQITSISSIFGICPMAFGTGIR
jgi:multidrug efflux pump subunit AcrB